MVKDLVIIGLGPAGIAASIYAKRSGLDILVFESKMPGGLLNYTNVVNNYPGFINITGPDLATKMFEHFSTFNIEYKSEDVTKIEDGKIKTVYTQKGEYKCKNIIIATGRSRRSLNLEGESDLVGKGISYCALCDGHFYKDKNVAVVGAGDSSLEESLYLAKIAKNVTIIVGILVLILFNVMRQTGDLRLHQWIWQRLDIISEWRYVGGEADHFFKMGRGQTVPLLQALKKHEEDAFRNILNA